MTYELNNIKHYNESNIIGHIKKYFFFVLFAFAPNLDKVPSVLDIYYKNRKISNFIIDIVIKISTGT